MTTAAAPRPHIFTLAWPLLIELFLAVLAGVVGTAMAARLSDTYGAAFAIANNISVTLFLLFRIVGSGIGVVITQNLGGGRRDMANKVALAMLGASTWLGVFTALLAFAGAGWLLEIMRAPAEVLPLATPFLQALAAAMLLDAWNAAMASVMRAHLRTRDTLLVLVAMHLSHLVLAWPLMYGWGPVPAMGLPGFALALLISRVLGLVLHLMLWRRHLGIHPVASDWWKLRRAELAAVLHIGVPAAAENIAWRLAFMASMAVAGTLGAQALATLAYVHQVGSVVVMFSLATAFAVEIMVGHMIGAGELREAHGLVRGALARGLVISAVISGSVALAGPWLLGCFTQDPVIIENGSALLWIAVLLELGRTFNLVVINALRAAGDARYPVAAGAASMAIVLAGGSWLLGIYFGLGLVGLWIAYATDEWIRGLTMWRRWSVHAWVPHARAARRRLRAKTPPL
ncbi:MATE family efflux transporter [Massilia sp. Root351]|uniref:MATE family efflux transporter n=1 Tax=Massilia sp. Root351 TaxID=1736522 RepID=UPI00070E43D6|nr:MATE family efflux transporter [Massilia sp. Root351]KQV87147.1 MATE family efflux transporter [Massilia sp. Root351]